MIGMLYSVAVANQAQTAAKTLFEYASPSDAVTTFERWAITQSTFDTSENLGSTTQRIATTGTGTATTPRPLSAGFAAAGGTCKTNETIEAIYGTPVLLEIGFNVLSGLLWTPANDDEVISISPSTLLGANLDVAPSGSMSFTYMATIREIGG